MVTFHHVENCMKWSNDLNFAVCNCSWKPKLGPRKVLEFCFACLVWTLWNTQNYEVVLIAVRSGKIFSKSPWLLARSVTDRVHLNINHNTQMIDIQLWLSAVSIIPQVWLFVPQNQRYNEVPVYFTYIVNTS